MASGYTYTSQKITGTSTTAKVFKDSGIKKAIKNDTCLNPKTGHVYKCETAGAPKVAKWKYIRTDIIGAPNIGYKNLSAPVRGNGNHKMTCTWKVPKDLVDPKNGRRATALLTTWTLGIPDSKDPKDVDKSANESLTSDTIDLNNFKVGSKTYTRNSFYPNTKKKLTSVSFSVVPVNRGKGSVVAKQTRKFEKPRTPSISAFSFNKENGELSCTITTNAGADYHERYDTRYKMYIYKSWEGKTTTYHDDSTTETSKTIKYDATGYQALTYEQYIRVKVEAWARGYAGDSEVTEKYYYIAYPEQATVRSVTFSGYTGADKCTVRIDTNQVKNKNGRVTHPTDKVTLEYLANVPYSSASAIPADTTWEDSGNLDDGQCTALAMSVANLICDPGNWSYLRVVTYHANEDVLFRYSEYKKLKSLHKDAPTAADDEIVVVSALPNADGESADVTLAWDAVNGSSADDATGTELSWDTDKNAWRSTKEPSKHEFEWYDSGTITHKGVTYRKKATITIKGLSEGETYYVRARRYLEGDVTTYGRYSPDVDPVVMTRSAEAIVASCDSFVAVGTSLPITWTLSGGGLQKSWSVVASNGTPIASGSGSIGYTQIDASRLARFAVNNVVTFTVQASTGTKPVVSESHTVRIVEKPTLEITGTSMVHVHEEDEQTYTGDIVEIDNSRDVLSTKSLLVTLEPIQSGSGTPSPDNVRPIRGRTEVVTQRTGKNLLNPLYRTHALQNNVRYYRKGGGGLKLLKGVTYTLSVDESNTRPNGIYMNVYDPTSSTHPSLAYKYDAYSVSFTPTEDVVIETDCYYTTAPTEGIENIKVQLEVSATATEYEPYNGDTYTTTLGQTVYGGTLDVVTGELTVTDANIASYNGETLPSTWISDRDEYASGTTPTIGAEVVYELAEPQTYQLTPQDIELLTGENNVWSDGDVELTTTEVLVDGDFLRTNNLSVNVRASTVCDLSVVVSSQGAVGQTPTGMRRQAFGDTVYSNLYRALQWTASGNAQTANVQLPTGLDFWDLGTYTVSITAIDRTSGLKSDEVTEEVKVYWARRAPNPADYVTITAVDEVDDTGYHIKGADIALTPPEDAVDTDVYDIYRYTGDGAELIGESFPLTYTARDLYAPFSEDGTQHYRIAIRTVDGDTEFADIEYIAEGEFLRFDWAEGYLELPYGVTMGDSYSKDVEFRKHMDGGTDGYWNENIERKGSYSSAVIKLIQPAEIDMARRLARFAGAVYVRTPEGTAYLADVQVTDLSRRNEAVMMVAFDATEVDLTAEYMLPTPYEKQD